MADRNKLSYIPNLDYKVSYDTIGNSDYILNTESHEQNNKDSRLVYSEDIRNSISQLSSIMIKIPEEISSIINNVSLGILYTLPYIKDTIDNKTSVSSVDYKESKKNNNDNSNNKVRDTSDFDFILPSSFDITKNDDYDIVIKDNKEYSVVDVFDFAVLSVYNDFLDLVKEKINLYNTNLILARRYGDITNLSEKHDKHSLDVDINLRHLSDNIIRGDVIYDQKTRLIKKLFNFNNSVNHFNAIYTAKTFYNRYDKEMHQKGNDIKSKFINESLDANLASYYNKYISSLNNISKYYNSCAVMIGDCLNIKSQKFVSQNILSNKNN